MVVEAWFMRMSNQVSQTLKQALSFDDSSKKTPLMESASIGILSFEISNVMSKTIHLYKSLSPSEISRTKETIFNSDGIVYLISEDEQLLMNLVYLERMDELNRIACVVSRLGKKCSEPTLQGFEHVYADLLRQRGDFKELGFSMKDVDVMIKKMERYVSYTSNLYSELEALNALEQNAKKFSQGEEFLRENYKQYEQKIQWQREDVKHLRDASFWNQTYDKIVAILARLVCTIYTKIAYVFRKIDSSTSPSGGGCGLIEPRTKLVSSLSDKKGMNGRSGPLLQTTDLGSFRSTNCIMPCVSGPGRLLECLSLSSTASFRLDGLEFELQSNTSSSNHSQQLKDSTPGRNSTSYSSHGEFKRNSNQMKSGVLYGGDQTLFMSALSLKVDSNSNSKCLFPSSLTNAPPSTVGGSALALRYANIIIILEKFLHFPHLVGDDARDDLYQMLPTSLRTSLRRSLRSYSKNLASAIYDAPLAQEWKDSIEKILSWLVPLAHNMITWQSGRNFEQHHYFPRTNVLLLQTLYFADKEKTEAAMCELLVGLNYICRYEQQRNALLDSSSSQEFEDFLTWQLQLQY